MELDACRSRKLTSPSSQTFLNVDCLVQLLELVLAAAGHCGGWTISVGGHCPESRVQSGHKIIIIIITFCQYQPRERGDTRYQLSYNEAYLPTSHYTGLGSAFHSVVTHTIPTLPFLCFKCSDEGRGSGDGGQKDQWILFIESSTRSTKKTTNIS